MARYCVHLNELEFEVDVDGDETDAIRTAREENHVGEVRTQRAHRLPPLDDDSEVVSDVASPSGGDQPTPRRRRGRAAKKAK